MSGERFQHVFDGCPSGGDLGDGDSMLVTDQGEMDAAACKERCAADPLCVALEVSGCLGGEGQQCERCRTWAQAVSSVELYNDAPNLSGCTTDGDYKAFVKVREGPFWKAFDDCADKLGSASADRGAMSLASCRDLCASEAACVGQ